MKICKVHFNNWIDIFKAHIFRSFFFICLNYGGMNLEMQKNVNFNFM
jgi:hypothetical protein